LKKAIFLTGSMGSGKSTILKKANVLRTNKYTVICDDFDVLGCNIIGADSLSHYKKSEVLNSLKFYNGNKLIIAGEYYSKQVDIQRYLDMGFKLYCILLKVPRGDIYKRIIERGNGNWKEITYTKNITSRINFFKNFKGNKIILENTTKEDIKKIYKYIVEL